MRIELREAFVEAAISNARRYWGCIDALLETKTPRGTASWPIRPGRRSKGGTASVHPIGGRELRALRRLQREGQSRGSTCSLLSAWRP